MAIGNAKKRKVGEQLTDWVYLGVRTGARRAVAVYRAEKTTDPDLAVAQIKHAVNIPHQAMARISKAVDDFGAPLLNECLALAGDVTLGEINTDLTAILAQTQTIVDHVNNDGWTWDQVATAIESGISHEAKDWVFLIPEDYIDIWGE